MIGRMPREKVAYIIIKQFMQNEEPSEELQNKFLNWFASPANREEKEKAMQRCFYEILEQDFYEFSEAHRA